MSKKLTSNEAAKYLGVSRSSLTKWTRDGLIGGGSTVGGHYRYGIEELNEFADMRGLNIPEENFIVENWKILLIEDDPNFREFVRDALECFENYELNEAKDGMQGVFLAGSWKPDIIILDIRMPNMNGLEFLKYLRGIDKKTKVIIASAHIEKEVKKAAKEYDVEGILEKPIRLQKLVSMLEKLGLGLN